MANWDFDNWETVCKDCERYKTEIRVLQEKQAKAQDLLVEKDKLLDDVNNFRQLIVNTDVVYKSLVKANAAKQRIKERNALYQERQRLMLSVMSRLIVLIFSSLNYLKLWEEEHKITKRAIDITVQQRQQLADKDVKLLSNEQLLKQYMALVAEQSAKLKAVRDLEREVDKLKNEVKKQSRQHKRTLERATSAFLEIMSQFHKKQKLSRKQISWMEVCEKAMVGKKVPEAVRYNPIFDVTRRTEDDDADNGDPVEDNVCGGRKVGTLCRDVAVGANDYAMSCDVCVGTEDLITEVCGVAGGGMDHLATTITSGSDDGCSEKSPDSGIQLPRSPLSQASDCSNSSVESFHDSHHSMAVPSPPPLEDGYMSDPPMSVNDARTSTPELMQIVDSEDGAVNIGISVEKQLENMFQEVNEVPAKTLSQSVEISKEKATPVDEKHSNTFEEEVAHSVKNIPDHSKGKEFQFHKQNAITSEDKETISNPKVSPYKEKQLQVGEDNVKSVDVLLFGDSDDEVAEAGLEELPEKLSKVNGRNLESPVRTVTRELWDTLATLTLPREKLVKVFEDDKMSSPGKSGKVSMRSIFDEPDGDEEEIPVGQQAKRALVEGENACREQVSLEQDLFGDTDEDDGWQAMDDESQSMQEDGKRTSVGKDEQSSHAEATKFEGAKVVEVCLRKEKTMILGDGTGVSKGDIGASVVEQDLCANVEHVRLGKLPVKTLQEGNMGSEILQSITKLVCPSKDDEVRSLCKSSISDDNQVVNKGGQQIVTNISDDNEVVNKGGLQIVTVNEDTVKDNCDDEHRNVNIKVGEARVEEEGNCPSKQLVSNDGSSISEDEQKDCGTVVSAEDKLRQQREETKSPEITRMIAEFTQFFLLSPMPADVVNEDNGEGWSESKRAVVSDMGALDLNTATTVTVVDVPQVASKSHVNSGIEVGEYGTEVADVSDKAESKTDQSAIELIEHGQNDLIADRINCVESEPSTQICRIESIAMGHSKSQNKMLNIVENNVVSKITSDLKESLNSCFTRILDNSVQRQDFQEFVAKEFTPFKNVVTETLEMIQVELTLQHGSHKVRRSRPERSTQKASKRKMSSHVNLPRKLARSSTPQQKTSEAAAMKSLDLSTSGLRNVSNVSQGEETVRNNSEPSESDGDDVLFCIKSPTKLRRRLILSSPESSDEEYENLKRQCEIRVCKVSLENVVSGSSNKIRINNLDDVQVPSNEEIRVTKFDDVRNLCVGRKNITMNKIENSDQISGAEDFNIEDECHEMEEEGKDDGDDGNKSESMRGRPKRNCVRVAFNKSDNMPANKRQRKSSLSFNDKKTSNDENHPKVLKQQSNDSVDLSFYDTNITEQNVKSATRARSRLNTTQTRLEKMVFKEGNEKIAAVCDDGNTKRSEDGGCDYKMPNAKPIRIAHKGRDDFEQALPDDIALTLKKEHFSKLLKTDVNVKLKPKTKKTSLRKKIISNCERRSKIKKMDEDVKLTKKRCRKVGVRNVPIQNSPSINDESQICSNAEVCKENLTVSRQSSCNSNIDGCWASASEHCELRLSSEEQEPPGHGGSVELGQSGLHSAILDMSACSDDPDGCRTPTFTEYYKGKLLSNLVSDTLSDMADGCKTPPLSECCKTDLPSQKLSISDCNNVNNLKLAVDATGSRECGSEAHRIVEPLNVESSPSGFQPPECNDDGRRTPVLSQYYTKELRHITSQQSLGCSDFCDDSTQDNSTEVVEKPLDGVACVSSLQCQQLASDVRNSKWSPVAVNEGITLTNHLDSSFSDSPMDVSCQDFSPVFPSRVVKSEPIKSEYDLAVDLDTHAKSDPYEDDGWVYRVTPPVKSYGRNRRSTSQPIKKEVDLMLSKESNSLETNSTVKNIPTLDEPIVKNTVRLVAVSDDSDSSATIDGDTKKVTNNNCGQTEASSDNPSNTSVSMVLRPRHCAAVVVSKPSFSSPLIIKPSHSVAANMFKSFYSASEERKPCSPGLKVPTSYPSTSFEKPRTLPCADDGVTRLQSAPIDEAKPACVKAAVEPRTLCASGMEPMTAHDAVQVVPNSLQGVQLKELTSHNVDEEMPKMFAVQKEPEVKLDEDAKTSESVLDPSASRSPSVKASGGSKVAPGTSGRQQMLSHSSASDTSKPFGCKGDQSASTGLSFKDCWQSYFVRNQRKMFQDRKMNKPSFDQMEEFLDGILTNYLEKEMSQTNVDATVYAIKNCTRGVNNKILAICLVRAAMENIGQQYEEVARGVPHLTSTEHHLLALVYKLNTNKKFANVKDMVLSHIVYGLFRLCRTPQAGVLYALSRFYVLLCLRYGQYTHILMLCCDALFTLSFGAFPVIYAALMLYDKALLRADIGKEHPLSLVMSHIILSQHNSNNTPLFKVENLKNLVCRKYGYERGEFMFRDVLRKLCDWLRAGRVHYMERALLILAKKEPWYVVYKEIVQKQLMAMIAEWKEKKLRETTVIIVVRLLGYIPRSFPRGPKTFVVIAEVLKTLSGLLGRPGNTAQFEEAVVIAVMALSNHCFNLVLPVVNLWKPLRPVPTTFFDPLYSTKNFKEWTKILASNK